ncbi:unnamed protein product [Cercospora beticola]|nr:unnamed protein product [Cercospora beticola]
MELKLDARDTQERGRASPQPAARRKPKKHFEVAADETLGGDNGTPPSFSSSPAKNPFNLTASRGPKSLLQVDSSGLSSLSLNDEPGPANGLHSRHDFERRQAEEEEMQRAIKEVERLRLELQRKQEMIGEPDDDEGMVVKRKKTKKKAVVALQGDDEQGGATAENLEGEQVVKKKRKKKKLQDVGQDVVGKEKTVVGEEQEGEAKPVVKVKRKKKRQVDLG